MSTRVYLLRHAKSSWKHPELADHDRPLAGRGRRAAAAMAHHMAEHQLVPDLVLCSTALRTRETYEQIEAAVASAPVRYERHLYGATADDLLERLHALPDQITSVMLIGHNPALQELALQLARSSPERDELNAKFPTAALATLQLASSNWRDLQPGAATLIAYVRPRDLDR
jgi:phosphohistidine phosphatase